MLPAEFENRMHLLLEDEYAAFYAALHTAPRQALRMNPLKAGASAGTYDPGSAVRSLFPEESLQRVPWCSDGFYFTPKEMFRPGRSPYHAAGAYYIQEPSAMAAAVCLNAQPGEYVLDLCAAPGGKSTQIAASMHNEGLLAANEFVPSRAGILSENIERMGIRNTIVTNESPQHLAQMFPAFFDRILVDAPCSGEGMFRKNPDAASEWSPDAVMRCAARQDEILSCAASMLSDGGTLVYSTCTFSPEENEGTLTRFLASHPDFYMAQPSFTETQLSAYGFSHGERSWYAGAPDEVRYAIRIFPHRSGGEGHFIAVLKKAGSLRPHTASSKSRKAAPGKKTMKTGKSAAAAGRNRTASSFRLTDALAQLISADPDRGSKNPCGIPGAAVLTAACDPERITSFGDQIYLLPVAAPSMDGIKVLRPGLHLGTMKKGRFEPAHALALTLSPADAAQTFALTEQQAAAWIGGQTIPVSPLTPSGWTLMTVNGYSLGWGKCANGMMKNHYPKGLRRG